MIFENRDRKSGNILVASDSTGANGTFKLIPIDHALTLQAENFQGLMFSNNGAALPCWARQDAEWEIAKAPLTEKTVQMIRELDAEHLLKRAEEAGLNLDSDGGKVKYAVRKNVAFLKEKIEYSPDMNLLELFRAFKGLGI